MPQPISTGTKSTSPLKDRAFARRPPPVFIETGIIVSYWEPFLLLDTSSIAFYSAMMGNSVGGTLTDELGGKNKSSDAVDIANESTFAQSHAFLLPLMTGMCQRNDYGSWWSEYDADVAE